MWLREAQSFFSDDFYFFKFKVAGSLDKFVINKFEATDVSIEAIGFLLSKNNYCSNKLL